MIHFNRVFHDFHFWGYPPIFGNPHIEPVSFCFLFPQRKNHFGYASMLRKLWTRMLGSGESTGNMLHSINFLNMNIQYTVDIFIYTRECRTTCTQTYTTIPCHLFYHNGKMECHHFSPFQLGLRTTFSTQVATNVETTKQAQPADFTCLAYHALKASVWWFICGLNWEAICCFLLHPRKLISPAKKGPFQKQMHHLPTMIFRGMS